MANTYLLSHLSSPTLDLELKQLILESNMSDHGLGIQIMAATNNVPNVGAIASGLFRHRTKVKNKFFRYTGENEQIWLSTPPWQLQTPIKMFTLYVCVPGDMYRTLDM